MRLALLALLCAVACHAQLGTLRFRSELMQGSTGGFIITTTSPLPSAVAGLAYVRGGIAATGGVAPYTFAVTSGALCSTFVLDSDGGLHGNPVMFETCTFDVTATDALAATTFKTFQLTVTFIGGTPKVNGRIEGGVVIH